jgi:hypothetical protein
VKRFHNFALQFELQPSVPMKTIGPGGAGGFAEPAWEDWMDQFELKFQLCLPTGVAQAVTVARITDPSAASAVQDEAIRSVRLR